MKKFIINSCIVAILITSGILYIRYFTKDISQKLTEYQHNYYLMKEDTLTVTYAQKMLNEWQKDYNTIYKVQQNYEDIYSMSFEPVSLKKGDTLKFKTYASDNLYIILRYSYPYIKEDLTKEEIHKATQLAIWNIASRTKEANIHETTKTVEELAKEVNETNEKIITRANNFVSGSANLNTTDTLVKPIFNYNSKEARWSKDDKYYVIGPYNYEFIYGENAKINISLQTKDEEEIPLVIVDKDQKRIEQLNTKQEFYILFPNTYKEYDLKFDITYKKYQTAIYEDKNHHDYLIPVYLDDTYTEKHSYWINDNKEADNKDGEIQPNKL